MCTPVLSILLAACGIPAAIPAQGAQPTAQITGTIDESHRIMLKGNVHPLVRRATDQGAASGDLRLERMMLLLKPSDAQQAALRDLLEAQQVKGSPQYHKWLTPAQFGEQYGVAQQDIDAITTWLQSHGFSIEPVSQGRTLIIFTGTHAQLQSAFRTTIHSYKLNGEQHYANAADPSIPAALAPAVSGIVALNNFSIKPAHQNAGLFSLDKSTGKWSKAQQTQTGVTTQVTSTGNKTYSAVSPHDFATQTETSPQVTTTNPAYYAVGPYDIATIYNVISLWNAAMTARGRRLRLLGSRTFTRQTWIVFARHLACLQKISTSFTTGRIRALPPTKMKAIWMSSGRAR